MWITILASIMCGISSFLFYKMELNFFNSLKLIPFVLFLNFLFWKSYKIESNYLITYFMILGLTTMTSIILNIFLANSEFNIKIIIGFVLIIVGSILINIK